VIEDDVRLQLTIAKPGADDEEVDALTYRLMRDLRDLGAESVERPGGEATPEGAKGVAAFSWGALTLSAAPSFLPKLVDCLQAWVLRGERRSVRIKTPAGLEVEFTPNRQLSQDELLALVEKLTRA
jgi:hypothetical protein